MFTLGRGGLGGSLDFIVIGGIKVFWSAEDSIQARVLSQIEYKTESEVGSQ